MVIMSRQYRYGSFAGIIDRPTWEKLAREFQKLVVGIKECSDHGRLVNT
jgi:hypothetical protein